MPAKITHSLTPSPLPSSPGRGKKERGVGVRGHFHAWGCPSTDGHERLCKKSALSRCEGTTLQGRLRRLTDQPTSMSDGSEIGCPSDPSADGEGSRPDLFAPMRPMQSQIPRSARNDGIGRIITETPLGEGNQKWGSAQRPGVRQWRSRSCRLQTSARIELRRTPGGYCQIVKMLSSECFTPG